jgi:hydrogenase maturation protease
MEKNLTRTSILVLGIGNILLRDEGVGVVAARELQDRLYSDAVDIVDGGTSGADLLDFIAERRKVIIIDSIDADAEPGTIFKLKPEDLDYNDNYNLSLHQLGIAQTLRMAACLGCEPQEVVIIGVKPFDLSPGIGLSKHMQEVLPKIIELVIKEI